MICTNQISRIFGKFAQASFPAFLQKLINKAYVKLMKLDMGEFAPVESYKSLNALFTRALKQPRALQEGVISPVDAFITKMGRVERDTLFQIKGKSYSLKKLLTSNYADCEPEFEGGDYVNFYLSPKDYHRYHIPCDMQVLSVTHVPGKLFPVNLKYLKKIPGLFVENERVIIEAQVEGKKLFLILIGALNVGQMTVEFEKDIQTNVKSGVIKKYTYRELFVEKGELLGYFKMGSTVVMVSQEGLFDLDLHEGSKVRFGEAIAAIKAGR